MHWLSKCLWYLLHWSLEKQTQTSPAWPAGQTDGQTRASLLGKNLRHFEVVGGFKIISSCSRSLLDAGAAKMLLDELRDKDIPCHSHGTGSFFRFPSDFSFLLHDQFVNIIQ